MQTSTSSHEAESMINEAFSNILFQVFQTNLYLFIYKMPFTHYCKCGASLLTFRLQFIYSMNIWLEGKASDESDILNHLSLMSEIVMKLEIFSKIYISFGSSTLFGKVPGPYVTFEIWQTHNLFENVHPSFSIYTK